MSLTKVMEEINEKHGQGSVMRLGDNSSMNVEAIPTGILEVDLCLGIGGIPRGRIVEVFGNESAGKSSLAFHLVKEAQDLGIQCAFVDAEHAVDPQYAKNIGIDVDAMIISQPDFGEQALDIVLKLVESGEVGLVIVDSVAALTPRAEIEGDIGDSHVGLMARMMGQALRKLTAAAHKNNCTVLFINQLREKIGVMFGSPEITTGGRALPFYASVRISLTRLSAQNKVKGEIVGNQVRVKIVKNKVAPPFRQVDVDIEYGTGFSRAGSILNLAVEYGFIMKKGAWFMDVETAENIAQGREAAKEYLKAHPDYADELYERVVNFAEEA